MTFFTPDELINREFKKKFNETNKLLLFYIAKLFNTVNKFIELSVQ